MPNEKDASTRERPPRRGRRANAQKGVAGEREVAALWQAAGFEVRGLESSGDWLVVQADGRVIHQEVKRHERPQWGEWVKQATKDCPQGVAWIVANRRSRAPWYAMVALTDLVGLHARIRDLEAQLNA